MSPKNGYCLTNQALVLCIIQNRDSCEVNLFALLISKVGTLSMAICAREMNKPMYVLAESFKFSLMYPLSQTDLPKDCRVKTKDHYTII